MLVKESAGRLERLLHEARPGFSKANLSMNFTKLFIHAGTGCLALALGGLTAGCQQGGGYAADQRDPIGPAPTGIASPGIGAPGGQSIDTRGSGSVASSEGDNQLTGPSAPPLTTGPATR